MYIFTSLHAILTYLHVHVHVHMNIQILIGILITLFKVNRCTYMYMYI